MKIDPPTSLGVVAVSVLCIFAVGMAIPGSYVLPGGTVDPVSLKSNPETDGKILYEINMRGVIHRQNGEQDELDRQAALFQQKLEEVANDSLEIRILVLDSMFFPIRAGSEVDVLEPTELVQACDVVENIPVHLQEIRKAGMFQMFAGKYSGYQIELILQDERKSDSWFHYGFTATSGDGKYASTYFHANSCTNEITDFGNYFLGCRDMERDYVFSTGSYDVIIASLNHEEFCVIPLDPWRQAVSDYSKTIADEMYPYLKELSATDNEELVVALLAEIDRLSLLRSIAGTIFDTFEDEVAQEMIQEYRNRFGPLPDDLQELLEQR